LKNGVATLGSWITLGHPAIVEILAAAGFDWLVVDLEHTTIGLREAGELIRVIDLLGIVPLVRLTSNDPNQAKRMLDAGAGGVIVPMVMSSSAARDAVAAVKYPPAGTRGVGLSRAQRFGQRFDEYVATFNDESVVIAQIEHHQAIADLDGILTVPGLDATMIGPYDLSASMGKPGQFGDAGVREALARYESVSRAARKPMGFHVVEPNASAVKEKIALGYTFIAVSVDFLMLGRASRDLVSSIKSGATS
jgi:2-keto-3-deoxy-L-rhamnonate aldolase RhmA